MSPAEPKAVSPTPVIVITGFLGSGKTTLLNRVLGSSDFRNAGVMINEFGDTPLDDSFVDHDVDGISVLAGGCLCCRVGDDFEDQLLKIHSRASERDQPLSSLIVETSGLADPSPLLQFLIGNPMATRRFKLGCVVCTADAQFAARQIEEHDEASRQIALADRVLITKLDLAPDALSTLKPLIRSINPRASIIEKRADSIDVSSLLETCAPLSDSARHDVERWLGDTDGHADHDHGHPRHRHAHAFESFTIEFEARLPWRTLSRWLTRVRVTWSDELLRMKGIVHCADEEHPLVLHGVHHIFQPPVPLRQMTAEERPSRLVFITRGNVREAIEASWLEVLEETKTRESVH